MYLVKRDILMVILLSIVTCGLYNIYLFFAFGSELKNQSDSDRTQTELTSPIVALLLGIVTCGIYSIFYTYKQALALQEIGAKRNVTAMDPTIVLIFSVFFGAGMYLNYYSANQVITLGNDASDTIQY